MTKTASWWYQAIGHCQAAREVVKEIDAVTESTQGGGPVDNR